MKLFYNQTHTQFEAKRFVFKLDENPENSQVTGENNKEGQKQVDSTSSSTQKKITWVTDQPRSKYMTGGDPWLDE